MIRGFVCIALMLLGACGDRIAAQDLGQLLTSPQAAAVPRVGTRMRPVSVEDPARLLMIGDSLGQGFGTLLETQAPARGLPIRVVNRGRVSTGLARGDYYNWPAQFAAMAETYKPDIVVAHFGANDMQTVISDTGRTAYGSPEWEEAYRGQIRQILAVAARSGAVVYWIGPGPDRGARLNAHLARLNPWFREETERAGGIYFPLDWTAAPDGSFARSVAIGGRTVAMRTGDGSHFTGQGYRIVADAILDDLVRRFPVLGPAAVVSASANPIFRLQ